MKTQKLKTYVLIVSPEFPSTHAKKGEKTGFIEQIIYSYKIHTIRSNYELWAKRINEVQEGKAVLSLRYWAGKPYKKDKNGIGQVEFLRLNKDSGVGVQKLQFSASGLMGMVMIDEFQNSINHNIEDLSKNDGLSIPDFEEWFKNYDLRKPLAIIHFTKFRY